MKGDWHETYFGWIVRPFTEMGRRGMGQVGL